MRSATSNRNWARLTLGLLLAPLVVVSSAAAELRVEVFDVDSERLLPCRVYVENAAGEWFTVETVSPNGSAVVYDRRRGESVEVHTTVSAHPFRSELPPGTYTLSVERGKEYRPMTRDVTLGDDGVSLRLGLKRSLNMRARGWYSGDTHVHRSIADLPNLLLAEDLNVALPLTYWVTEFTETPLNNSRPNAAPVPEPSLIEVSPNHVIWPVNTEYEIFTVNRKRHTLGAVFVLNHQEPLDLKAHPAAAVAAEAERQGAILEFDKHNWPWSMMLPRVMGVHLYELSNNHIWRTEFLYGDWYPEYFPKYLSEAVEGRYTERQWIEWGFANYYALLNCGFEMMATAGTASGVHPVPLGFGRVYVYLGHDLDFDRWMKALEAGRSFVTTGPMLDVRVNGQLPGTRFRAASGPVTLQIEGCAEAIDRLDHVDVLVNGEVVETFFVDETYDEEERIVFGQTLRLSQSGWLALRCYAKNEQGRIRFAHTSPYFVEIPGQPLRPRLSEVDYLIERVENEIKRHTDVLPKDALAEYEAALKAYQGMRATAY